MNKKDCEMNFRTLEFKNKDIEESFLEIHRAKTVNFIKWISIMISSCLFAFNYYVSNKNKPTYGQFSIYYLFHSDINFLCVLGFMLFLANKKTYYNIFEKIVFIILLKNINFI